MTAVQRSLRRSDQAVRRCRKLRVERLLRAEKSERWTTALLGATLLLEVVLLLIWL